MDFSNKKPAQNWHICGFYDISFKSIATWQRLPLFLRSEWQFLMIFSYTELLHKQSSIAWSRRIEKKDSDFIQYNYKKEADKKKNSKIRASCT